MVFLDATLYAFTANYFIMRACIDEEEDYGADDLIFQYI
jgi:hypothetical protein